MHEDVMLLDIQNSTGKEVNKEDDVARGDMYKCIKMVSKTEGIGQPISNKIFP
jgi:hypothetical protein